MSLSNFFYPTSLSIQLSRNKFFQMTFLSNDFIRRNFYQTASSRRIFIKWHHRNDFLSNVFIETIFHHRLESSSKRHFIKRFYQNDFSSKDFNWNDFFFKLSKRGKSAIAEQICCVHFQTNVSWIYLSTSSPPAIG